MNAIRTFAVAISTAAILVLTAAGGAVAQTEPAPAEVPRIITETFDSGDIDLILGGQLAGHGSKSVFDKYLAGGEFVLQNRTDPNALHYNDISWVTFPGTDILQSTEGTVISAVVRTNATGTAGAGILVGSGTAGKYIMFAVDGAGHFHVLQKDGRSLRRLQSAKHAAVVVGGSNTLTFDMSGANIAFYANDTRVLQVPFTNSIGRGSHGSGSMGIGLAAFGLGQFFFEGVEIKPAN